MLSPTQFKPMTTVSARLPISDFPRPLPAIVHPEPEVRPGDDTSGDHVVDPRRKHYRVLFFLSQLSDTNRFRELEPMPRFLRNAKSEHNCRVPLDGHPGGGGRGPRRAPQKGHEDAFTREDGLVGKH